ncbi:MAG: DUF3866 family protein [Microthrixaceae bacterium]
MSVSMEDGTEARAYALVELTGACSPGDQVICNTTAVDRSLGTGGWHVVHWNLANQSLDLPGPEHIMKLRYTSLQADVGTSELMFPEQADRPLEGQPVIVCTLHSQMALVALGFAHARPDARLAYLMTDGAALPIALSDLVHDLCDRELLVGTVTAGHAFGGDLEAVGPASALGLAAHVLEADAIVVAMGPGVVGTGTAMGTTALEAATLIDLAGARGGKPVLCVRTAAADGRQRHLGVSHHVHSVLDLAGTKPLVAEVPEALDETTNLLAETRAVGDLPDPAALLSQQGMNITTMGRGPAEEPTFFTASVAAGVLAARLCP